MLPHPGPYQIPAQTAAVARAAFPKGTLATRLADSLGVLYEDTDFAALYSATGRPGEDPVRLALVSVFQFLEGLSDRQAADAVRGRIDWKYALRLELTDPGFDYSVLSEFRARLLAGGQEQVLFDKVLAHLRAQGLLKARGRQRTDSTHVLGAIRNLNRLEFVIETMRHALNTLAVVAPDWIRTHVPADWVLRYDQRAQEYRLPDADHARTALAEAVGQDGFQVLAWIKASAADQWLLNVPAIQTRHSGLGGTVCRPPSRRCVGATRTISRCQRSTSVAPLIRKPAGPTKARAPGLATRFSSPKPAIPTSHG
jgi:transposase